MRLTSCLLAVAALACLIGSLTMPVMRYANRDFAQYDVLITMGGASTLALLAVPVIVMAVTVIVVALTGVRTRVAGAFAIAWGVLQLIGGIDAIRTGRDNVIMWDKIDPNGMPIAGAEHPDPWWGLAFAAAAGFALIAAGLVQIAAHCTRAAVGALARDLVPEAVLTCRGAGTGTVASPLARRVR